MKFGYRGLDWCLRGGVFEIIEAWPASTIPEKKGGLGEDPPFCPAPFLSFGTLWKSPP